MNKPCAGVFELCVPEARVGQLYKFRVYQQGGNVVDKADPYAFRSQLRPDTASVITRVSNSYKFHDAKWLKERTKCYDKPMNIYEMHMGSWKKPYGKTEADSRVQMSTGVVGDEYAGHDSETPGQGDDDPTAAFTFTLVQTHAGAYAVT